MGYFVGDESDSNVAVSQLPRKFRCDARIYRGFDKNFSTPHRLALCQDEDTLTVWALDEDDVADSVNQLLEYIRYSGSQEKLIGTYREEGFRGFKLTEDWAVSAKSRFKG